MLVDLLFDGEPESDSALSLDGNVHFHPRYEQFLRRIGLGEPSDFFKLSGEIVGGHPDRSVMEVTIGSGPSQRRVFLKREHSVGWRVRLKNLRAGFGWVSRSEREAYTLAALENANLPGPQWLAYGHDANGRAFLLVDEIANAAECRVIATRVNLTPTQRRKLIVKSAETIASFHNAGFTTPELAAKHLFVNPGPGEISLIDWQSSTSDQPILDSDRQAWLAGLQASLTENAATPRERLRFARAYVKSRPNGTKSRLADFVKPIVAMAETVQTRTSKQLQRHENATEQRLVWLADEIVCVIPEMVRHWPKPVDGAPFYCGQEGTEPLTLADRDLYLTRFVSDSRLSRAIAWLRGKPWRSPAAQAARVLFHLERFGITAPKLIAFGQKLTGSRTAESFIVYESIVSDNSLSVQKDEDTDHLFQAKQFLERIHSAGCCLNPKHEDMAITWDGVTFQVTSPFAVVLCKTITQAQRRAGLRRMVEELAEARVYREDATIEEAEAEVVAS